MDVCPYCGIRSRRQFKTGRNQPRIAKTCGDEACRRRMAAERTREWQARHPKPDRMYACKVCSAEIVVPAGTVGGPRSLCVACLAVGPSVAVVRLRLQGEERHVCPCGKAFTRAQTKGQRPRWCSPACMRRAKAGPRRVADYKRRSRLASVDVEQFEPVEIFERDGWRCRVPGCGRLVRRDKNWPHPLSPSIDHIIPVSDGGHHVRANVRCAHLRCNLSRGNRGGNDQLLLIG